MTLPLHEYILAMSGAVALAALFVRLLASGLARLYKFFFCYIIVDLAQTAAPFFVSFRSLTYFYLFVTTEALMVCLYALILFELYAVLFRDLKGISHIAKRYTAAAIGASIVTALLLRAALPPPQRFLEGFFYFESAVILSLAVFVLLITAFLIYYPIPLHRNAVIYSMGYALYFLSKAALLFLNNAGSSAWWRGCSTAALAISTGILGFWAIFLNRAGEKRTVVVGHRWGDPGSQRLVVRRLTDLNNSLVRARGK